jgi:hypothetical protein
MKQEYVLCVLLYPRDKIVRYETQNHNFSCSSCSIIGQSVAAINSDLPASQCEQGGVFQVVQLYSQ